MNLAAQAVGLAAFALGIFSLQCRKVRTLLLFQMAGNIAFIVHYLMLGGYSACVGQAILTANILMIVWSEAHENRARALRWVFTALSLLSCALVWQDMFSILPGLAAAVTILTNWTGSDKKIRLGKLCLSCPIWIVYDIHVGSWSGILCEMSAMLSALLAVLRFWHAARAEKAER